MKEIEVAMVIAREETGKFLAMKKNLERTDKERYMMNPWETAGGKIEEGETAPEAGIRELEEEAKIDGVFPMEEYPKEDMRVEHKQETAEGEKLLIDFYPVPLKVDKEEPNLILSEEHSDYAWMSKEEFEDLLPEHNVEGLHRAVEELR